MDVAVYYVQAVFSSEQLINNENTVKILPVVSFALQLSALMPPRPASRRPCWKERGFFSFFMSFNLPPVHPSLQLFHFSLSPFAPLEGTSPLSRCQTLRSLPSFTFTHVCIIFPINVSARLSVMRGDALLTEHDILSRGILQKM